MERLPEEEKRPLPSMTDHWCADFDTASNWWSAHTLGPPDALEPGCGGGATAVAAATAGYVVTGVDVSERRIAGARRQIAAPVPGTDSVITQYGRCCSRADFLELISDLGLEVAEFRSE